MRARDEAQWQLQLLSGSPLSASSVKQSVSPRCKFNFLMSYLTPEELANLQVGPRPSELPM